MGDFEYNVKLQYGCSTCGTVTETYTTASTPILQTLSCNVSGCKGTRRLAVYEADTGFIPNIVEEALLRESCAKDMGGIWLPDRFGIEVFVPVKCNQNSEHGGTCCYIDSKSGLAVLRGSYEPTLRVDNRGCVVTKNYPLDESDDSDVTWSGNLFKKNTTADANLFRRVQEDRKIVDEMTPQMRCAALRSGTKDTLNAQAVAEHQAKICGCYLRRNYNG